MKHPTSFIAMPLVAASLACATHAQAPAAGGTLGKQIADGGAGNVVACASCHGAQGEGNAATNFPRIAGQPHAYLARQLKNYANGSRNNAVMAPIAKALSPKQVEAVSAYYAALAAPAAKAASKTMSPAQKRGQLLANVGDESIAVQACANCHGPGGVGEPPDYPYLASQHGGYLTATLAEWKKGARKTDPSGQMPLIARRLADDDIAALAAYYSAQPAPPPASQRINVPAGSAARPAAPGAPGARSESVPTRSLGTEQGAPTGGGETGGGGGASGSGPSGTPK
jgi:cytochrome c553